MTRPPPPLFTLPQREYDSAIIAASLHFKHCSHVEMAILLRRMLNRLLRSFAPSERLQFEKYYAEYHKSLDAGGRTATPGDAA
jgi:hypothetical protein